MNKVVEISGRTFFHDSVKHVLVHSLELVSDGRDQLLLLLDLLVSSKVLELVGEVSLHLFLNVRHHELYHLGLGNIKLLLVDGSLVDLLRRRVTKTGKFPDVSSGLDLLGPDALRVLKEMLVKGLGLDDPVSYIRAKAARYSQTTAMKEDAGEEDEIAKLTIRINRLNKSGGQPKPIQAK